MPLTPQTQRLNPQQQLLRRKRIQSSSQIPQNLNTHTDSKRNRTKGIPELQSVVAFGRFVELREARGMLAPIELPAVNDDAADGRAVATNPFCGGMDHDVGAVVDGADEVAACAEGVVDLYITLSSDTEQLTHLYSTLGF